MNKQNKTTIYTLIGWISAIISLMVVPILFGIISIIMAVKLIQDPATKRRGVILLSVAIAFMVIGILVGAYVGVNRIS